VRVVKGSGAQRTGGTSHSFLITGIRVATSSISGIAGQETPIRSSAAPIPPGPLCRRDRLVLRRPDHSSPFRPIPVPSRCVAAPVPSTPPMRAGSALFRWRVFFVLSRGWCLFTVTRCETAADLLHTGSRALLVDCSDGHDPENAGDPRLRQLTTRSRVDIQWVTSHFTVFCTVRFFTTLCSANGTLSLWILFPRYCDHRNNCVPSCHLCDTGGYFCKDREELDVCYSEILFVISLFKVFLKKIHYVHVVYKSR